MALATSSMIALITRKNKSKGENSERQGNKLEQQSQRRVQQSNYQHRDQGSGKIAHMKTGNKIRNQQQCACLQEPPQQKSKHLTTSFV